MRLSLPGRRTSGTAETAPPDQEPAAQEPAAQEPAAQEPAAQEPAAQEPAAQEPAAPPAQKPAKPKRPLYVRLLHLRHIAPNAWQRAVLGEGSLALAVVLVLADLATAWTLIVLPLAVAALVKAHDLLAWLLGRPAVAPPAADEPKAEKTARNARTAPSPGGGAVGDRKS